MTEKKLSLEILAGMVKGTLVGDNGCLICGVAPLDNAGPDDLSFLAKANESALLQNTGAGVVIVPSGVTGPDQLPVIQVRDPYLAIAIIHSHFLTEPFLAKGIHPRAVIGDACILGKAISIAPQVVIGNRVKLGERVSIEAGSVVGDDVCIDDDTTIKANVIIYNGTIIGKRVVIHSGTVVGADGFGYAANERGEHIKRPQVGIVQIDDDVEIGANCCIDRATFGTTLIKSGAKIDNLVQIGHNVVIGENSLLVSQVGIAGSTILGRNVVLGGQVGVAGHLEIGDQVMVAAKGGIHNNQPKGAVIGGTPAIPIRQWAKCSAVYAKLPELQSMVRNNTRAIAELTGRVQDEE